MILQSDDNVFPETIKELNRHHFDSEIQLFKLTRLIFFKAEVILK